MIEFLILLLPVAAASGWLMAQRSYRKKRSPSMRGLSSDYFKGLNYLLNEQQDKAIEVFIKMVEVDSETVETHLALGNLFRRRGEVDRAIRIHQNIIARPTLNRHQRSQALYELGMDYMRAGLFDRAENLFLELIDIGEHVEAALSQLTDIYQQEKDWDNALKIARKYQNASGEDLSLTMAHYFCEMADEAVEKNDLQDARRHVKRALAMDRNCARASILMGHIETISGDYKAAINAYKNVEHQDPDFIPVVIEPIIRCYEAMHKNEEALRYLRRLVHEHSGITPVLALADELRASETDAAATEFITEQMRLRPSVRGLEKLIEMNLSHVDGSARDNLLILNELVKKLLEDKPVYKCSICGFSGREMHWHCPSCKSWNSVKPITGITGE